MFNYLCVMYFGVCVQLPLCDVFWDVFRYLCELYFGMYSVTYVFCRPKVQEVVVYSLLFTEAGQTLLGIIATGSDNVDQALVQQGR